MRTSDNDSGPGGFRPLSLGDQDLFFARELLGKLSTHVMAIRDLEGWADGTPPDSMKAALGMEDYDIARRGSLSPGNVGNVIAEEARRCSLEKLSSGETTP